MNLGSTSWISTALQESKVPLMGKSLWSLVLYLVFISIEFLTCVFDESIGKN